MAENLGNKVINSQYVGNKAIIRTYKGDELINEYKPLYNPPSDWFDIRTDCPDNSIALYAAHKSDYSQYDNLGFTATCTNNVIGTATLETVGSPTISNGVASGFSSSNYLQTNVSVELNKPFEIATKITTSSEIVPAKIIGLYPVTGRYGIVLYIKNNKFSIMMSHNGNGWEFDTDGLGSYEVLPNTTYYLKFYWDYNSYKLDYSLDGTNYINEHTINNNTSVVPTTRGFIGVYQDNTNPFNGSIDLNETYIKLNGEYFLAPYNANGYKVFIDGTQYGTTYASGAQCDITWSTSGITTGDNIITPSALVAHKIWIESATEGNNITAFKCSRVAASGTEAQGVLWAHFNLTNAIMLDEMLYNDVSNGLCEAITAKNNKIALTSVYGWSSGINRAFANCNSLEYVPLFETREGQKTYWESFKGTQIKKVKLSQGKTSTDSYGLFQNCQQLEKIEGNFTIVPTERTFVNCQSLEQLPTLDSTSSTNMSDFIVNAKSLKDTVLDVRDATGATRIGCFAQSSDYFMSGFKGLRVSNSAPFSGTSPQINVKYTGLDKNALVQLFNDLPTVSAGQIINITNAVGADDLTADDKAIATAKGWTIAL